MSRLPLHVALAVLLFVAAHSPAHAALQSRLGGLAFYDTILDVSWLADANAIAGTIYDDGLDTNNGRVTWASAKAWAENLVVGGVSGWRLPRTAPVNGIAFDLGFSNNGSTDLGGATSSGWVDPSGNPVSELGHNYYVNLGNLYFCTPNGGGSATSCNEQPGWGLVNTPPFSDIQSDAYWFETEVPGRPNDAWIFGFANGPQNPNTKTFDLAAWAVHDGDVGAIVPLPGGIWFFAGSIVAMLRNHRRR